MKTVNVGNSVKTENIDSIDEHEPNEETIAAFREAENLDNLTNCVDLQDMLKQCGIKR